MPATIYKDEVKALHGIIDEILLSKKDYEVFFIVPSILWNMFSIISTAVFLPALTGDLLSSQRKESIVEVQKGKSIF